MGIREDNIKIDLNETGSEGEDWIHPVQIQTCGSCEHGDERII
jgi:hypothetical protein